jgi:hypothetical protein
MCAAGSSNGLSARPAHAQPGSANGPCQGERRTKRGLQQGRSSTRRSIRPVRHRNCGGCRFPGCTRASRSSENGASAVAARLEGWPIIKYPLRTRVPRTPRIGLIQRPRPTASREHLPRRNRSSSSSAVPSNLVIPSLLHLRTDLGSSVCGPLGSARITVGKIGDPTGSRLGSLAVLILDLREYPRSVPGSFGESWVSRSRATNPAVLANAANAQAGKVMFLNARRQSKGLFRHLISADPRRV